VGAQDVFTWAALALYGLACALYTGYLAGLPQGARKGARGSLGAAFLFHACLIGARGVAGMHPVSSVGDAVGFAAWLLVGSFLAAQLRRSLDAVGAFVAPVAMVMLLSSRLAPDPAAGATAGLGALGRIHISLATVGVAIFGLATGLAIFYLLEERQLKRRRVGGVVKKGVALETLDALAHRCVLVGFPIFTVAMVAGAAWVPRANAGLRAEYPIAGIAWTAFAALLVARTTSGWRGRRAALLTLVGFGAAVVVLALYLARRLGAA
jgi:ABC-type uncharacterized transport system permease subunit